MGTNDGPNDPTNASVPDSRDQTLSGGGPGGAAAGHIGPYRLLQPLGEGGMGEVWLAEQKEPIRRTVALKLIKTGMDTKAVVARFESERQALALMDHPNIAQV
jgi:serine/threonine protein kinase